MLSVVVMFCVMQKRLLVRLYMDHRASASVGAFDGTKMPEVWQWRARGCRWFDASGLREGELSIFFICERMWNVVKARVVTAHSFVIVYPLRPSLSFPPSQTTGKTFQRAVKPWWWIGAYFQPILMNWNCWVCCCLSRTVGPHTM